MCQRTEHTLRDESSSKFVLYYGVHLNQHRLSEQSDQAEKQEGANSMASLLTLAYCYYPNPFGIIAENPLQALWVVSICCCAFLMIEAILLCWPGQRVHSSLRKPLIGTTLGGGVWSLVLAIVASRSVLYCAAFPNAPAHLIQLTEASVQILVLLQSLIMGMCTLTFIQLAMGIGVELRKQRRPRRRVKHGFLLPVEIGAAYMATVLLYRFVAFAYPLNLAFGLALVVGVFAAFSVFIPSWIVARY